MRHYVTPVRKQSAADIDSHPIGREEIDLTRQHWETKLATENFNDRTENPSPKPIKLSEVVVDNTGRDINENVDTHSIGDLAKRKKQWETFMKEKQTESQKVAQQRPSKPQVRHWEVKTPDREHPGFPRDPNANISQEQLIGHYRGFSDPTSPMEFKHQHIVYQSPTFHEMTEADRGTSMADAENFIEKDIRELRIKEELLKQEGALKDNPNNQDMIDGAGRRNMDREESLIEMEIRLQKEREQELARQRALASRPNALPEEIIAPSTQIVVNSAPSPTTSDKTPITPKSSTPKSVRDSPVTTPKSGPIRYPEVQSYDQRHAGEHYIVTEMREARQREEELRKQREQMGLKTAVGTDRPDTDSIVYGKNYDESVGPYKAEPILNNSIPRRSSVDSQNSSSTSSYTHSDSTPSRSKVIVQPYYDEQDDQDDDVPSQRVYHETVVEMEKRMARERDEEYRRARGLAINEPPRAIPVDVGKSPQAMIPNRKSNDDKRVSMKQFASSQLQHEIERERQREKDLKREGTVRSISDDHVGQPMKYVEVKTDQIDGGMAVTKKRLSKTPENGAERSVAITPTRNPPNQRVNSTQEPPVVETPPVVLRQKPVRPPTGADHRKSHNPAESRIEQEMREMRQREEELRNQRKSFAGTPTNGAD